MKHKVSELEGALLDAAVAQALGWHFDRCHTIRLVGDRPIVQPALTHEDNGEDFEPSRLWAHGGPIIERERISMIDFGDEWWAVIGPEVICKEICDYRAQGHGPTQLIAAMRAFVASKIGEEVDLSECATAAPPVGSG